MRSVPKYESGSALEAVCNDALYKYRFTLLFFGTRVHLHFLFLIVLILYLLLYVLSTVIMTNKLYHMHINLYHRQAVSHRHDNPRLGCISTTGLMQCFGFFIAYTHC